MKLKTTLVYTTVALSVVMTAIASAIIFGGPNAPLPMASMSDPFKTADLSDLPARQYFQSDDRTALAYRAYVPSQLPAKGSVVLVHGSSGESSSMHLLAESFRDDGYAAYALDMRGHGASGIKGTINYVGQLEDDIDAFVREVAPARPSTLVGFSAGGGFVVRFAGSNRQNRFDSYLLLAPYLGVRSPTNRANAGGWLDVGRPRLLSLMLLNGLGIRSLNDLPVMSFALNDEEKKSLTPTYSFLLAENFSPHPDSEGDIKAAQQPCAVVAGADDEVFQTKDFEPVLRSLGKSWQVTLLPGIRHLPLILEPDSIAVSVRAVGKLQSQ